MIFFYFMYICRNFQINDRSFILQELNISSSHIFYIYIYSFHFFHYIYLEISVDQTNLICLLYNDYFFSFLHTGSEIRVQSVSYSRRYREYIQIYFPHIIYDIREKKIAKMYGIRRICEEYSRI